MLFLEIAQALLRVLQFLVERATPGDGVGVVADLGLDELLPLLDVVVRLGRLVRAARRRAFEVRGEHRCFALERLLACADVEDLVVDRFLLLLEGFLHLEHRRADGVVVLLGVGLRLALLEGDPVEGDGVGGGVVGERAKADLDGVAVHTARDVVEHDGRDALREGGLGDAVHLSAVLVDRHGGDLRVDLFAGHAAINNGDDEFDQ
mmetsp:Transcript_2710/g.8429  ORF Transcript_2710/g.8429 Transcript_2710/m.8429 type:complete len:206 (-) Transcript_2710:12-629(-)